MARKLSTESFIEKCITTHGEKYDYSGVVFDGVMKKVKIICRTHGEFSQRGDHHIAGRGCPSCRNDAVGNAQRLTIADYIEKCKIRHNNYYDYSKTLYNTAKTNIIVTCPIHGDFNVLAWTHHKGAGCLKCAKKRFLDMHGLGIAGFLEKAVAIHGNVYDYSLIREYKGYHKKLPIICSKHGVFFQNPNNHISGKKGCPICNSYSKSEKYINKVLSERRISFSSQKIFHDFRSDVTNRPYRFDFYLDEVNAVIEYDGKHHFESISHWGGEKYLKIVKEVDHKKTMYCRENSICLYRIHYKQNLKKELDNLLCQLFSNGH
jgi:hypothetical protein